MYVCVYLVYIAVYNIYVHIYHCINQFKYVFLKSLNFRTLRKNNILEF